jgi:hypothetical protein
MSGDEPNTSHCATGGNLSGKCARNFHHSYVLHGANQLAVFSVHTIHEQIPENQWALAMKSCRSLLVQDTNVRRSAARWRRM